MLIVLTGAPGAGKGTQAELLVARRNFKKISTGDALRSQVKLQSDIGKKANDYMSKGHLVPDEILLGILKAEFSAALSENILLDGYPRNINQAATLKSLSDEYPVKAVVHLEVDEQELIRRLSGRRVCENCGATYHIDFSPTKARGLCDKCGGRVSQRSDDHEDKVKVRLRVFESETKPILDFYEDEGRLYRINGAEETEKVFARLTEVVDSLR